MKKEFLNGLGITEQSVIDQIMAENGRDVEKVRGELTAEKQKVTNLQTQLNEANGKVATLETQAGDTATLNQQIAQLQTDKTNLENELNTKVTEMKKTYAIENGVRDAKARNVKAVIAQLDMSKITYENDELGGLSEQLDALKTGEDTSFLFGESNPTPAGTHINTPPSGGGTPPTAKSFAEAVSKALGTQN